MSVRTVLTNLEEDEQVEAPPVAPPERQEVYRQSIAFVAPVIASEDEVTAANEMHSQNELLNTKAVIGIFDQEGTSDPNARIREEAMLNAGISGNTGERQNSKVRVIAQVMPRFPGGKEEMYRFLQNNLSYPQLAIDNRTEGKVTLSFIVETNGEITAIQVVRGISPECDREASRVVAAMPRWLPVEQNGRPVRVQFTLPVFFVLQ
jgi:protein TonB